MFARNVKNGRDTGQNRSGRNSGPIKLPGFMRSDPDGELATMYRRIKTASSKSKLPGNRNRHEIAKKRPMTDEYAHIRSPVSDYIRQPFIKSVSKQVDFFKDVPPVPERKCETTRNASTLDYSKECVGDDFAGVDKEELGDRIDSQDESPNSCEIAELDSVLAKGIAEVQLCESTVEVFACFAQTYHDLLERVTFEANTSDASTQTSIPKLQRSQMNLVYAGFWESCSWRQNRSMQTEEQNLTFAKQPTAMLPENSCEPMKNWVKKLFDWKCFGMAFVVSAVFLGLMEIPKFI